MFHVGIDMGGTFTDFIVTSSQETKTLKLPTNAANPLLVLMQGLEELAAAYNLSLKEFLGKTDKFVHGTTIAINALLQGKGAKTALLTTEGFRDALEIRRSQLSNQWDLRSPLPPVLVPRYLRLGIRERIDYKGDVLIPLDEEHLSEIVEKLMQEKIESVACCFLFSFKNPVHEQRVKHYLKKHLPGVFVTISSEVAPKIKDYERTSTTVLNAYLGPLLSSYLNKLEDTLTNKGLNNKLYLMQNSGGLSDAATTKTSAVKVLMSGPAGGAFGCKSSAQKLQLPNMVLADMGGTSFDVSLIVEGANQVTPESEIEGYPLLLPMIQIKSIGAGGGSIAWLDASGTLNVGPQSAGAVPGPACYDRGGKEPTVTDAALVLGLINQDNFLGGNFKLDQNKARNVIEEKIALPLGLTAENGALAICRVAASLMTDAVHLMTVQNGLDPREFALLATGGASPLFAGEIAKELGMETIIIPAHSSVYCAKGMLQAGVKHDAVRSCLVKMDNLHPETLLSDLESIKNDAEKELFKQGIPKERQCFEVLLEMKYSGQHHEITVPLREKSDHISVENINNDFHLAHEKLFGYCQREKPWEIVNIRVTAGEISVCREFPLPQKTITDVKQAFERPVYWDQDLGWQRIPVISENHLPSEEVFSGPGIIETPYTTIFVPEVFITWYDKERNLIMKLNGGNRND